MAQCQRCVVTIARFLKMLKRCLFMKNMLLSVCVSVFASQAMAQDVVCPAGAVLKSESMPEVTEQWCELTHNGKTVMHGPYQARWGNGQLGTSGRYEFGEQHGTWQEWDEAGVLQDTSVFEKGKQVN